MSENELVPATPGDNPFHLEPDRPGFESLGQDNGFRYWRASALGLLLGYASSQSFFPAVQKAIGVCMHLGIDLTENIVPFEDAKGHRDYKLSRFACYLAAMNGDSKKPEVARAQAYFAAFAASVQAYLAEQEAVERVHIRGKVRDHERSLSGVAHAAGVQTYAFFQNAGYRGLYNMNLSRLRTLKRVPSARSVLDFMGSEELAANLFRITQTESKIRNEDIRGQTRLEEAAHEVGRKVRKTIKEIGGTMPEHLPASPDILQVQKKLKSTQRTFKKLDGKKKKSP
jgi:DNA-damage-inducible protein D